MALILITPPAMEPVSLAELKQFLRVDAGDTTQDDTILSLEFAARSWAETYTRRRFVLQTVRLLVDFFPGYIDMKMVGRKVSAPIAWGANAFLAGLQYAFELPLPPVQRIVLFQYLDANGNTTVMAEPANYTSDLQSNPARLAPPFGQFWPVARVVPNAVQLDYEVGYAMSLTVSSAGSPPDLKTLSAADYIFQPSDVGRPISVVGGGPDGGTLNTFVDAVSSPLSTATLRDALATVVASMPALLVNAPNGDPAHWALIKSGIRMLAGSWYDKRTPDQNRIPESVKAVLGPVRDLRL